MQPHARPAVADGRRVVPGQEEALAAAELGPDDNLQVVELDLDAVVNELADDVPPA
jgi:hypothetical protein